MALVVEDGTGLANADSYLSLADATAYLLRQGKFTLAETTGNVNNNAAYPLLQEVHMWKAAQYVDFLCQGKAVGIKVSGTQALVWPRRKVARDGRWEDGSPAPVVPDNVKWAQAEAAELSASGEPLLNVSDQNSTSSGAAGQLILEREEIGPLVEERRYSSTASTTSSVENTQVKIHRQVEALLEVFFANQWFSSVVRG